MKQLVAMAFIALSVVSCNSMDGDLNIQHSITLEKKSGLFGNGRKSVTISEGHYEATLNPTSSKNVNLELKVDGDKVKIPFSIPEGMSIPQGNSQAMLYASDSGQPYDLKIRSQTSSYDSSPYTSSESCVLGYDRVQRCETVPGATTCRDVPEHSCERRPNGNRVCRVTGTRRICTEGPSRRECHMVDVPIYGSQLVTYVDTTTIQNVSAEIEEGSAILANFHHQNSSKSSHRVGTGACR